MNNSEYKACVVGIGSPQGNDSVGWRVVKSLDTQLLPSVQVEVTTDPVRIVPVLGKFARLWIVDACRSEQKIGTITRFAWPDDRIDRHWTLSGHGVGLAEVLELAGTLGSLPRETVVYTIDIGRGPNMPVSELSADVAAAAEVLRERLVKEVSSSHWHPSGANI